MAFRDAPMTWRRALIRRPSPKLADGLITHIDRVPVDVDDERKPETAGTAATLRELGYAMRAMTSGSIDGGDVLKIGRDLHVRPSPHRTAPILSAQERDRIPATSQRLGHITKE